jgi:hypothetical protein
MVEAAGVWAGVEPLVVMRIFREKRENTSATVGHIVKGCRGAGKRKSAASGKTLDDSAIYLKNG